MMKELKIGLSLLLVAALAITFSVGWLIGVGNQPPAAKGLGVVEEAWKVILRDYVGKDEIDIDALSQGAIRGMLEVLDDPHTSYLDSETYQLESGTLDGSIEGIGATMGVMDGQPLVITVFDGSPAAEAGIRGGDTILEVDGKTTAGMSLTEAVLNIRGPVGTVVSLLVRHVDSIETELIEVTRAKIEIPSVYFEELENIAYILISYFSERTGQELAKVVQDINQGSYTGIILDMRGNPGGLLEAVVDCASSFVDEGVIVYVAESGGERIPLNARSKWDTTDLPMVALVDEYSASGAEVLAGALQDYQRAAVAGTQTYGKGSAGVIQELEDGSAIYITTARWLTPSGRLIEGEGLTPDYELDFSSVDAIQWAIDYLEGR